MREGRCEFTLHALEEMEDDGLEEADVMAALSHGWLARRLADDPRGTRFAVRARLAGSSRRVEVVARFVPSGRLRIITAYRLED